jgi:Tfp pilus assembly protein PilF
MASLQPNDKHQSQPYTALSPTPAKAGILGAAWFRALVLVAITFLAYAPVWHAGFVWDDETLITDNRLIKAEDGLYRFWFTTEARDYYPLSSSLAWLEWRCWGNQALGYHVVNVLLHALNVVLVWIILRHLKILGAWLAAAVFAVHPVNVATVAWVSEQKNTLSMLFCLVALLSYLRFDEMGRWQWYVISLGTFLLALLSKSAVAMLPIVLLGCVWWRRGRIQWRDFICSLPFLIFSLILGLATIWFQYHRVLRGSVVRTDGLLGRFAIAGWAPWFYLYKALLPCNLSAVYPRWEIDPSRWVVYAPAVALVICFTLFWWKRRTWGKPLLFGLGCFVAMLFPVLGLFDQDFYQYSFVADPWQYYSIIAPIALTVAAVTVICRRLSVRQDSLGRTISVLVLVALGLATWERSNVYGSEESLWRDTVRKNPEFWMPHYNLGTTLLQAGKPEEAINQLEQAAQLGPDRAKVHSNLGLALAQDGRLNDAVAQFKQALKINPELFEVHANLGHALMMLGKTTEAIAQWEQALRIEPRSAEINYDLGQALEQSGRIADAIKHYEQALRIKPDYGKARQALIRLQSHGAAGQR